MQMISRRNFVENSVLASMAAIVGQRIGFGKYMPKGLLPVIFDEIDIQQLRAKHPDLVILNDRPINAETPAHLLDETWTSNDLFFVRNNGIPPKDIDKSLWKLRIEGESAEKNMEFSLDELKENFETVSYYLTLECGGNGRSEFNPPAKGNQWTTGAVGCAKWTGVRLKDVLNYVGVKSNAVYVAYEGADTHLSGDPTKLPISRGVPIDKAMEEESLIAWAMNDEDIPLLNGYPLRLVFGGWPASCSGKWLTRIRVRNKEHDGAKMKGQSYRVPKSPVAPGTKVPDEEMKIIEAMPVKSLITAPKTGMIISKGKSFELRGSSWVGDSEISKVEYTLDFGSTWIPAELEKPINRNAWQRFNSEIKITESGYYEIWAKATDKNGKSQPMVLPGWNPRGYLNNACHRIAIRVKDD